MNKNIRQKWAESSSISAQQAAQLPGRLTAAPRIAEILNADPRLGAAVWRTPDEDRFILIPGDAPTMLEIYDWEPAIQAAKRFLSGEEWREVPFPDVFTK